MGENNSTIKPAVREGGFFSKSGQLKSKEELKQKVEVSSSGADTAASSSDLVSKALNKVEDRFRAEVGVIADEVNRRSGQLKQGRESLKKEKEALQNLKVAFDEGDQQKIDAAKNEISLIRSERDKNTDQINQEQRISPAERSIRIGDSEIARVKIPRIQISRSQSEVPEGKESIKEQIQKVSAEIDALDSQRDEIKAARKITADALGEGRGQIDKIAGESLKSIETAQQSASRISLESAELTRDELLDTVAGKINPAAVSQALRS